MSPIGSVVTMDFQGRRLPVQVLPPRCSCVKCSCVKCRGEEDCGKEPFCLIEFKEQRDQVVQLNHPGNGFTL